MKRSISFWLIICFTVLLSSCSTVKMIKSNMDYNVYSMSYEMDSVPPITSKKNVTVSVEPVTYDSSILDNSTRLTKGKRFLFPLGVINTWEFIDTCVQGRNAFKDNIPAFLQTSLVREINYSSLIKAEAGIQSDYTLELSVDKLRTEGQYKRSGISFLMLITRSEVAGPAISSLRFTYTLKKGNQVVIRKTISSSKATDWGKRKYVDNAIMQQDYAASMVKATALNIKMANKLIIDDLNDYFSR